MKVNISKKTNNKLIMAGFIGPIFFFTLLTILGLLWSIMLIKLEKLYLSINQCYNDYFIHINL